MQGQLRKAGAHVIPRASSNAVVQLNVGRADYASTEVAVYIKTYRVGDIANVRAMFV